MSSAKPKVRLYVEDDLKKGGVVALAAAQSHYLGRVMRLAPGDGVALFNGRHGEWRGVIERVDKKSCAIGLQDITRRQPDEPDLWLAFAPLKKSRTDFLVEKATELGVSKLLAVFTDHTDTGRINTDRLGQLAIEAAEQCRRLSVPEISSPLKLPQLLAAWPPDRRLLVADESGGGEPLNDLLGRRSGQKTAILIGPEGGFSRPELDLLAKLPFSVPVGLGPRILRAETAALAALVCVQSTIGDWGVGPRRV